MKKFEYQQVVIKKLIGLLNYFGNIKIVMENKINIAELLKNCPKGMELDCTICNNVVTLECVDTVGYYPIRVMSKDGFHHILTHEGCVYKRKDAKCVIFPKGKTTWEGFVPPYKFKDGDVLAFDDETIVIFKDLYNNTSFHSYCHIEDGIFTISKEDMPDWWQVKGFYPATEEQCTLLFRKIKEAGYHWNAETKTLEKLPKFQVGDKIKHKDNGVCCTLGEYSEGISAYRTDIGGLSITYKDMEQWELAPNKFDSTTLKPFDKVLVRRNEDKNWRCSFFSHMDEDLHTHCYKYVTVGGKSYPLCIPYEGNEHLCGTTDDCDEFYKNW